MKRVALMTALLALATGAGSAYARTPSPGEVLASQCAQCHGTNGNAVSSFPSIAGDDMYGDMLSRKRRTPEGIMDMQARGYTDEQLRLISDFFATLPEAQSD